MTRKILAAAALCALVGAAQAGEGTSDLTVKVTGLRAPDGVVRLALYNVPEEYPRGEKLDSAEVPADGDAVEHVFTGLAPGRYALAVYHDENGNGEFDQGTFGIPKEGYAFSNGAPPGLTGPPSFRQAAIEVNGSHTTEVIELRH